ncbi:MAG: PEP-CTERM sorting domain-containing protein [Rhodocyclaceae bacterium]|nr:PEP-CTERM sorting domain-containing protein [Rhodocyclaceae bacterium]
MVRSAKSSVAAALVTATLSSAAALYATQAQAVPLPTADCGSGPTNNCLTYNDFNVYSLPLLQLRENGSSVPGPGDTFYAPSTFGQIQDFTIIGINNGQSTNTGNPQGGTDGSYNTPSANQTPTFSTRTTDDPFSGQGNPNNFQSEFFGDAEGSWDATTSAMLSLTNNTPVVFFFAFNETGNGTGLLDTDLLIWGKVTLIDADDPNNTLTFFLGGDTGTNGMFDDTYTPLDDALPAANGTNDDFFDPNYDFGPWVYVHAGICADGNGNFLGFPDTNGQCAAGSVRNQNNLGQNAAAFMVHNPDLDAALLSGTWEAMQVTWEMAYLNGGGETAWIMPVDFNQELPEPSILGLIALGLIGAGAARRRSAKA